jgi:hypothetical protein
MPPTIPIYDMLLNDFNPLSSMEAHFILILWKKTMKSLDVFRHN